MVGLGELGLTVLEEVHQVLQNFVVVGQKLQELDQVLEVLDVDSERFDDLLELSRCLYEPSVVGEVLQIM